MCKERKMNEVKDYLRQYRDAKERIREIEESIENYNTIAESCTAQLTGMPSGSGTSDKVGDLVSRISDLIIDAMEARTDAFNKLVMIEATIKRVDDTDLRRILYDRYINLHTWEQIAVDMSYSYQWVCVLHGRALAVVADLINFQTVDSN